MKMDMRSYTKLCYVAGAIADDIETDVENILDEKGEKYSGNIDEYLDVCGINSIDPTGCSPLYDMQWALKKIVEILTNTEVTYPDI